MAWVNSPPGSGGRAASPTVFEQQREELVREIAMVSDKLSLSKKFHKIYEFAPTICNWICVNLDSAPEHGTSTPKHQPSESEPREHHHSTFY